MRRQQGSRCPECGAFVIDTRGLMPKMGRVCALDAARQHEGIH